MCDNANASMAPKLVFAFNIMNHDYTIIHRVHWKWSALHTIFPSDTKQVRQRINDNNYSVRQIESERKEGVRERFTISQSADFHFCTWSDKMSFDFYATEKLYEIIWPWSPHRSCVRRKMKIVSLLKFHRIKIRFEWSHWLVEMLI